MAKKRYLTGLSLQARENLSMLADNIREARVSRGFSIDDAASRCLMAKATYQSVEQGRPETSMGAYLSVLDVFGLTAGLADVAAPHRDEEGRRRRLMKRMRR